MLFFAVSAGGLAVAAADGSLWRAAALPVALLASHISLCVKHPLAAIDWLVVAGGAFTVAVTVLFESGWSGKLALAGPAVATIGGVEAARALHARRLSAAAQTAMSAR